MPDLTTEAIKRIHDEVEIAFNTRVLKILAMVGVANVVALLGIYSVVVNRATTVAEQTAASRSATAVENQMQKNQGSFDRIRSDISTQHEELGENRLSLGEYRGRVSELSGQLDHFSQQFQDADVALTELSARYKVALETPESQILNVIKLLNEKKDLSEALLQGKELSDSLADVKNEVATNGRKLASLASLESSLPLVGASEMTIGDTYFCWSTIRMSGGGFNRTAKVKFPRRFSGLPTVLTSLHANGSGHNFAVYSHSISESTSSFSAIDAQDRSNAASVDLTYLAIGKIIR